METHTFYVVFLACHFVWLSDCLLPYGTNERNEHLSKRGPDTDRGLYGEGRSRTSNSRSCSDSFDTRNNYIIRTQESLDNDATFIDALKVETAEACMERCCDANDVIDDDGTKVMCDASVFVDGDYAFENKESNCFIFQCRFDEGERFRCKFSDHDSYISSMVGGFGEEPYFEEDEEEEEIPQTKQATTTSQDEWKTNAKEPANTEAVEECNENQFQCDNGECIRLTLLCDDYDDCQDKSDESEQCDTIEDGNATPHNGKDSRPIYPTNPPKLPTTNTQQEQTTTNPPHPEGDDTIFSELANQLHKEGAKQKIQDDKDTSDDVEKQNGNRDKSEWHAGRPSSEDDELQTSLPPNTPDDNYNDDEEEEHWRPRQKGRPYGDYVRPSRPLRPKDRYGNDDYPDYPKRPVDDDQDDDSDNNNRGGDNRGGSYENRYRGQDDDSRYRSQETKLSYDKYKPDSKEEHVDDKKQPVHEDNPDKSSGKSFNDYRPKAEEKETNKNDPDENDGGQMSSKQRLDPSKSSSQLESTKEDWYGQNQKSPDSNSMDKAHQGGKGRVYPEVDDGNEADYNKNDYQDYFGNYYNDRNPYRGNPPNRYPPNNYRIPYGQGQGNYQDYADYSRNRMFPGGRGRGRGRGYNRNWQQMKNPYGDGQQGGNGESEEFPNEIDLDDKQGDARDHGNPNSADIPHSRRHGLWKIWKYMYGSSAQDYATEYPPNAEDENEVEEGETGAEVDDDENDVGDVEVPNEEVNDLEPDDNLPAKNDTSPPGQGNADTTMKPIQTHQSSLSSSEDPITPGKTTNNSDAKEVVNHVSQPSMVHIADKQSVTATAVLPLTIGLFLTMFLLLMMSCRLRYMNRRLRYGRLKTNNVHDADYLINGMYL